jgi:DNA-binding response OmpR family regulator
MATPPVVLLVEDNAELRLVLKEALAAEGYQVLAARDEAAALDFLRERTVNLLISDISGPPDTSGVKAVRTEFPDLPVVTASTGDHPSLVPAAWQSPGRHRTLQKPFRLRELLVVSREALEAAP